MHKVARRVGPRSPPLQHDDITKNIIRRAPYLLFVILDVWTSTKFILNVFLFLSHQRKIEPEGSLSVYPKNNTKNEQFLLFVKNRCINWSNEKLIFLSSCPRILKCPLVLVAKDTLKWPFLYLYTQMYS